MAKRERYNAALKCPTCGREGRVYAEENENPVHGRDLEIEGVTEGFKVEGTTVTCEKCGDEVMKE